MPRKPIYRVYVGCALTGAPECELMAVQDMKVKLEGMSDEKSRFEVLEFLGTSYGSPTDVYEHDLGQVRSCDVMVAFVDRPSIGLGMEIATAIQLEKPLICLHRPETAVSRMLLGARDKHLLAILAYTNADEAARHAWGFITFQDMVWHAFG